MIRLFITLFVVCCYFTQLDAMNSPFSKEAFTFKAPSINRIVRYAIIVKNATDEPVSLVINKESQFKGKLIDSKNGTVLADFEKNDYKNIRRIKSGKSSSYVIETVENDSDEYLILTVQAKSGKRVADISVNRYTANVIVTNNDFYGHKYTGTHDNSCMIVFGESEESVDEAFSEEMKKINVPGMPPFYKK